MSRAGSRPACAAPRRRRATTTSLVAAGDQRVRERARPRCRRPAMIADVAVLLGGARLPLSRRSRSATTPCAPRSARTTTTCSRGSCTNARFDDVARGVRAPRAGGSADRDRARRRRDLRARGVRGRVGQPGARCAARSPGRATSARRRRRTELLGGRPRRARSPTPTSASRAARASAARSSTIARCSRSITSSVLRDLGGRMTADHISAAAEAIERTLPRRLPAEPRSSAACSDTQLADDTLYPGRRLHRDHAGRLEREHREPRHVRARLHGGRRRARRVHAALRRGRAALLHARRQRVSPPPPRHRFALGADLDDARVKDRDLPWQRLVLALGVRRRGDPLARPSSSAITR